jgi:serine/threonine protein kinase
MSAAPGVLLPGGYHPVYVGEKFKGGRYTVLKKLGWGHFSTVWLVLDNTTGTFGAMKVQKSAQHYTEAARDEVTLLSQIAEGDPDNSRHCVRLLDNFDHSGEPPAACLCVAAATLLQACPLVGPALPLELTANQPLQQNHKLLAALFEPCCVCCLPLSSPSVLPLPPPGPHGRHVCMVFEVLGVNLLALIRHYDYKGIPLPVVRNLARQMLVGLDYLHRWAAGPPWGTGAWEAWGARVGVYWRRD